MHLSLSNLLSANADACKQSLLSVIESQIIPQLMHSHPPAQALSSEPITHDPKGAFSEEDIQAFVELCLQMHLDDALEMVMQAVRQGAAVETLYLELITPAARVLGHQWVMDQKDFTSVTHGLMQMHQLTRRLANLALTHPVKAKGNKRILLASAPGSLHILGLCIVSELFRSDGWQVVMEITLTEKDLKQAVKREWFDVIGLSVGLVEQLPQLPQLIQHIKQLSLNPGAPLILGGAALLNVDPSLIDRTQADGIATDAREAVTLANQLLKN